MVKGGNAEIDGDKLQVNYSPTYYTPVTDTAHPSADQLGSQLAGIDAALSTVGESAVDVITLVAADITAGYVDLTERPKSVSRVTLAVRGAPSQTYAIDFTVAYIGAAPAAGRLTWIGNLATTIEAGDVLTIKYDVAVG